MSLDLTTIAKVLTVVATVTLGVPGLIWIMRRTTVTRRVLVSAIAFGAASVLIQAIEAPGPMLTMAWFLLGVNAGLQVIELFVWELVLQRWLHLELPRLLVDLFVFIGLAAAAFVGFTSLAGHQLSLSDVLVTSTVLSAVLGFALQPVLSNVFSGLALHLEGPFSVGEWVLLNGREGQIVQMGWRTTTLRTRDNQYITVPNGQVAGEEFLNYDRPTTLQALNGYVGVSYKDPPAQVKRVMIDAALDVPQVRKVPAPTAYTEGFGDFAIQYRIKYWITDYSAMPDLRDAVMTNIWYSLKRHGMVIPFPIRDVTLHPEPDVAAAESAAVASRITTLRSVDIFAPLTDEQVAQVATGSWLAWYGPGESIVQQGELGDSMFVIRSGAITIEVEAAGRSGPVHIADRGPGAFFGEMSLLTGEPRVATVRAAAETEVVVVDKAAFSGVLLADDEVAGALAKVLAIRVADTAEIVSHRADEPLPERSAAHFLRLIRGFFAEA